MENNNLIFSKIKNAVLFATLFILPLFFLPFTQEYFVTGKLYLLVLVAIVLIILSAVQIIISKKIVWYKKPLDSLMILAVVTTAISIILISPNKVQALINPNFGLVMILAMAIIYYYAVRVKEFNPVNTLSLSAGLLGLITIIFYFQPFVKMNLPNSLVFLKNPGFTPVGNQLDLALFLGFATVIAVTRLINNKQSKLSPLSLITGLTTLIGFVLTGYGLVKTNASLILPPFHLSWYAALETLKTPLSALFGSGVDNYSSTFTKIKDLAYNQSNLWQTGSFIVSRSTLLHILTETGLFGLTAFILIIATTVRMFKSLSLENRRPLALPGLVVFAIFVLFPPSMMVFLIGLIYIAAVTVESMKDDVVALEPSEINLAKFPPLFIGIPAIMIVLVGVAGYFIGRTYLAEYYFKQSLNGYVNNNIRDLYEGQRLAIITNPYIEKFRINFSQTNLLIANNIINQAVQKASSVQNPTNPTEQNKINITAEDQQTISQAIQASISEAKAAIALNPERASNWENLAVIYRSVSGVVQGEVNNWIISAYQRAIVLDPQNPAYRLNLGGIYFGLNVYEEAVKLFEQTISLKPDWSNAYYNLAWANFRRDEFEKAAANMQNVVYLLDPKKDVADYKKATAELEEFKKKLPQAEVPASPEASTQPNQLNLPTPPAESIEPKVQLPKEASPEAR